MHFFPHCLAWRLFDLKSLYIRFNTIRGHPHIEKQRWHFSISYLSQLKKKRIVFVLKEESRHNKSTNVRQMTFGILFM